MKTTLFELKEKMAAMRAAINSDAEWLAENAGDPSVAMEEIEAKKSHRDELQKRYETLKFEHDQMESAQKATVVDKAGEADEKTAHIKAKAAFYRAAMGQDKGGLAKAYAGLGAIPAGSSDLGSGEHLLPKNVATELITEPSVVNTLREVEPLSQISGLEEPKLLFSLEDTDLEDVADTETAREIELSGDSVAYGRYKTKIFATVKDSVYHGTDTDLVSAVEAGLRSGLATKEMIDAFRTVSDTTHDHMSFYLAGIKEVEGDDLIQAIINAWADLPDAFSANAKCVMRRQDYYAAIRSLVNGADTLMGKKPEDVLGIPVVFNDRAVTPVVGDFSYSRQNYDIGTTYETDKDGKKGEYYFILTAWGDHQIRLKSAFRLAKVKANP